MGHKHVRRCYELLLVGEDLFVARTGRFDVIKEAEEGRSGPIGHKRPESLVARKNLLARASRWRSTPRLPDRVDRSPLDQQIARRENGATSAFASAMRNLGSHVPEVGIEP